jgi:plastocyanin
MNKLFLVTILIAIFLSGCTTTTPSTTTSASITTSSIITSTSSASQQMITIYCVNNNCSPQQVAAGAGTLVQGCYRSQTDCLAAVTTTSQSASAVVLIKNFAFSPSSLTVSVGTTVTWTNQDSASHTVTSDSGSELNSATLSTGQSFSHTFTQAGTFAYHCTIHPFMKATVTVQ